MLITKQKRRRKVRSFSAEAQHRIRIAMHRNRLNCGCYRSYRLSKYGDLIQSGLSDRDANKILRIWENGVQSDADELELDRIRAFLIGEKTDKRKSTIVRHIPVAA